MNLMKLPTELLGLIPLQPGACWIMIYVCHYTRRIYGPRLPRYIVQLTDYVAESNNINLLSLLDKVLYLDPIHQEALNVMAARCNSKKILKATEFIYNPCIRTEPIIEALAKDGNLEMLQWISKYRYIMNYSLDPAAEYGHLHIFQWAHNRGINWLDNSSALEKAAHHSHLDIVQWLVKHEQPVTKHTLIEAAAGGHLDMVKWLRAQGCVWKHSKVCQAASESGNLELIIWIHHNIKPFIPNYTSATAGNHLHVLKWFHQQGYVPDAWTRTCSGKAQQVATLEWLEDTYGFAQTAINMCAIVAESRNLDLLKYVRRRGYPWNEYTALCAVRPHNINVFRWIVENDDAVHGTACEWNPLQCLTTAKEKHKKIIEDTIRDYCPWVKEHDLTGYEPIIEYIEQYLKGKNDETSYRTGNEPPPITT